jgi:hypothetical protein
MTNCLLAAAPHDHPIADTLLITRSLAQDRPAEISFATPGEASGGTSHDHQRSSSAFTHSKRVDAPGAIASSLEAASSRPRCSPPSRARRQLPRLGPMTALARRTTSPRRRLSVRRSSRGPDATAEITDGQRLILVEVWYPADARDAAGHALAAFGDYFARDRDLLLRTERALLTTSGFAPAVVEQNLLLAPKQFDVPRGSYRDLPLSGEGSFPVILYSRNAPAAVHQRCPGGESDSPRSRRRRSRTYGQRCPGAVRAPFVPRSSRSPA